jgi:hypothetical protein
MTQAFSFDQVQQMLRDEDPAVQFAAVNLIGRLNDAEIEQLLAEAMMFAVRSGSASNRTGFRGRLPLALGKMGERVYRKITNYLRFDTDPLMLLMALESIETSFRIGERGPSPELIALVTADDVSLLEALLLHPEFEIRFKAGELLILAPFNSMVVRAPQIASWWLSDRSGNGKWFFAAQAMLEAFGERSNTALSLCVSAPLAVLAAANVGTGDRMPEIVRDRACDVMIKLGAVASPCGTALLSAIKIAKDDRAPKSGMSLQHLCRAFITIQAPAGLGEEVRSLILQTERPNALNTLLEYFHQQPGEGLEEIVCLLEHGQAEEALDLLITVAVDKPDSLRPHIGAVELHLNSTQIEFSLRAATVLVGLGKDRLAELCPNFAERMSVLTAEARADLSDRSSAAIYVYLLRLSDALEADQPGQVIEIRKSVYFAEPQTKRRAA